MNNEIIQEIIIPGYKKYPGTFQCWKKRFLLFFWISFLKKQKLKIIKNKTPRTILVKEHLHLIIGTNLQHWIIFLSSLYHFVFVFIVSEKNTVLFFISHLSLVFVIILLFLWLPQLNLSCRRKTINKYITNLKKTHMLML